MNEPGRVLNLRHPLHSAPELNEFCICRVIEDCALIKIESMNKLHAAKKYMRRIASRVPGSYVIFSYSTRRILGKVVSRNA